MAKYNPTSLVKMNMGGMGIEQFIAHSKRAHYLGAFLIDSNRECARLYNEAGVLYPVSRIYPFEPRPDNDNPTHIKAYAAARYEDLKRLRADAQSPNVIYQINCERGFVQRDFLMYIELIKLAVADPAGPIGMCFWNGASGAVKTGFWGQENEWKRPFAIEFLKLMHEQRNVRLPSGAYAFSLGVHNYTSQYPTIATNAGQDRKQKGAAGSLWTSLEAFFNGTKWINWKLAQDHVGRDFQGIMLALGWEVTADGKRFVSGANTLKDSKGEPIFCCWLIGSEMGYDNMNDVRDVHRDELIIMAEASEDYVALAADELHQAMAEGVPQAVDDEYIPMTRMEVVKVGAYGLRNWLFTLLEWLEKFWLTLVVSMTGDLWAVRQALDTPRGYRSLAKTWAQSSWFPGRPAGYILGWTMRWKWRVIHSQSEVMIFQAVFCEGQTSAQWAGYNIFGDTDYINYAESAEALEEISAHFLRAGVTVPPPVPPTPPASTDPTLPKTNAPEWFESYVCAYPARTWIYSHRDTGSAVLGYIHSASKTDYSQRVWTVYNPRNGRWRAIKLDNGVIGWIDETLIDFDPDTPPFNITATDERWRRHNFKVIGTLAVSVREKPGEGEILKKIEPVGSTGLDLIPLSMLSPHEASFLARGSEKGAIDYYFVKIPNDGRMGYVIRSFVEATSAVMVPVPMHEWLQLKAELELSQKLADDLAFDLIAEQDKLKLKTKLLTDAKAQAIELQHAAEVAPGALADAIIAEVQHQINNHLMALKLKADDLVSDLEEVDKEQ